MANRSPVASSRRSFGRLRLRRGLLNVVALSAAQRQGAGQSNPSGLQWRKAHFAFSACHSPSLSSGPGAASLHWRNLLRFMCGANGALTSLRITTRVGAKVRPKPNPTLKPTPRPTNKLSPAQRIALPPIEEAICLLYTSPSPRD